MNRHAEVEWHAQHSAPRAVASWTKPAPVRTRRTHGRTWLALVVALAGAIVLLAR